MVKRFAAIALLSVCFSGILFIITPHASAAAALPPNTNVAEKTEADTFPFNLLDGINAGEATSTVQIIIVLTILTIAPSILIMVTGFTRIVIVLSFVRNAMGTMQMPPNQVLIGLALFLTFFIMWPVLDTINKDAIQPFEKGQITLDQAVDRAVKPIRNFMFEQISIQGNETSLKTFINLAEIEQPEKIEDIPTHVLIPAFIASEIKTAFKIGFLIFIPFIVIDMIVASALMSMGMMMLPPVMISLPFKVMLFVLVDGWNLTINSLVATFKP